MPIIHQNKFVLGALFQIIKAEIVEKIKIIVQTLPIIPPPGARLGNFKVLYHVMPALVRKLPKTATAMVIKGMIM